MAALFVWACAWISIHLFISGGCLRNEIVSLVGETAFQILFSALSAGCLIGLCMAYAGAMPPDQSLAPLAIGAFAIVQMLSAFLIVGGLTTRSPTAVRGESLVGNPDVVRGILRITRHPFLWGIVLWAFSYPLIRRDVAALVFAGALGFVAARGMWSIERKRRRAIWSEERPRRLALQDEWWSFNNATSCVPMWAIFSGRQRFVLREIGALRVLAALGLWFALLYLQLAF